MNRKAFIKNMGAAAGIAVPGLGCSKEAAARGTDTSGKTAVSTGKVAVVYFSWSGNTRFAAETIAKKAGAALFEIKAETSYNSDFNKCCDEAKPECYGKKLRAIKPIEGLDLAKYDVVFVGTPDWWGTMAPPVRTWVTRNKDALKGKTVCIFQTHGGGGMERVGKEFAEVVGDAAKILPPKAFPGASVKSATKALEAFVTDRLAVK
nr:NAD(P)H-dependent oxidoreductase [Schwartzia sp. (in: firmicutes)]